MLYEITTNCRIANKEYKKGDIVTIDEVWQYFTTVMKPLRETPINKVTVKEDAKAVIEEPKDAEEPKEEVKEVEEVKQEPKKASKKKK